MLSAKLKEFGCGANFLLCVLAPIPFFFVFFAQYSIVLQEDNSCHTHRRILSKFLQAVLKVCNVVCKLCGGWLCVVVGIGHLCSWLNTTAFSFGHRC
jgi:hypothetical protein